jgi:hypothetical protein
MVLTNKRVEREVDCSLTKSVVSQICTGIYRRMRLRVIKGLEHGPMNGMLAQPATEDG